MKEVHNELRAILKRCERLEKIKEEGDLVNPFQEYDDLPREQKRLYQVTEKILRKRNSFRLEITEQEKWENSSIKTLQVGTNGEPKITSMALFSRDLLGLLFEEFIDFKEQLTIRKLDKLSIIGRNIASYNRMVEDYNRSLPKGRKKRSLLNEKNIKKIIKLMQHNTIDELVKEGVISKRSKYNYLQIVKKIGIGKNAILDVEIEACSDFELYNRIISETKLIVWK
jgi:hypothetical protein